MSGGTTEPGSEAPRVGVVAVAPGGAAGEADDRIAGWIRERGWRLAARETVPARGDEVVRALLRLVDREGCDLVLTAGGLGPGEEAVTPEATRAVLQRTVPGLARRVRGDGSGERSVLGRGTAGTRGRALVANLPGDDAGARSALRALDPVVDDALEELRASGPLDGRPRT